jgi:hypothetical protein
MTRMEMITLHHLLPFCAPRIRAAIDSNPLKWIGQYHMAREIVR